MGEQRQRPFRAVRGILVSACVLAFGIALAPQSEAAEPVPVEMHGSYEGDVDWPDEGPNVHGRHVGIDISKDGAQGSVEFVTGGSREYPTCRVALAIFDKVPYLGDDKFEGTAKGFVGRYPWTGSSCSSFGGGEHDVKISFTVVIDSLVGKVDYQGESAPFTLQRKSSPPSKKPETKPPGTSPPGTTPEKREFAAIAEEFFAADEMSDIAGKLNDKGMKVRMDVPKDVFDRVERVRKHFEDRLKKEGLTISDDQKRAINQLETAILMAHAQDENHKNADGEYLPALPSLLAMEPILMKLGAQSLGPPYNAQAATAFNNLTRMTVYLELEGVAPKGKASQ